MHQRLPREPATEFPAFVFKREIGPKLRGEADSSPRLPVVQLGLQEVQSVNRLGASLK